MRYELCDGYLRLSGPAQVLIVCNEEENAEPISTMLDKLEVEYDCISSYGFEDLKELRLPALLIGEKYLFSKATAIEIIKNQQRGKLIVYGTDYAMLQQGLDLIRKAKYPFEPVYHLPEFDNVLDYSPEDEDQAAVMQAIAQYERHETEEMFAPGFISRIMREQPKDTPVVLTPPDKPEEPHDGDLPF